MIIIGLVMLVGALALSSYNIYIQNEAKINTEMLLNDYNTAVDNKPINDKMLTDVSKGEMITEEIDGFEVVGKISYPNINIELPVVNNWSYEALRSYPCRYEGTAKEGNMIVMAHNYSSHFGRLKLAKVGDEIAFSDSLGETYNYKVSSVESINGNRLSELKSGEWDLTLFTCNYSGQERVVVRCVVF